MPAFNLKVTMTFWPFTSVSPSSKQSPRPFATTCGFLGISISLGKVNLAVKVDFAPVKVILAKSFSCLLNISSMPDICCLIEATLTAPVKLNSLSL